MLEHRQKVRKGRGVVELFANALEHGAGTFRIHVDLIESFGQLLLVIVADHFEKVQMPIERFVFAFPQLIDNRLNSQHEELVSQMKSELQVLHSGPVVEDCIDEGHDGRLDADVVSVLSGGAIEVVNYALETSSLVSIDLIVQHCFEHLFMASWDEAHGAQNFQHIDLGFEVFGAQTLSNDVHPDRVSQHVGPASLKTD